MLSAGTHDLLLEIGDVNDGALDSAIFLANLRVGTGTPGTGVAPEPGTLSLLGIGVAGLLAMRARRPARWRRLGT